MRTLVDLWESNAPWMTWNLFLAIVPVAIGALVFRRRGTGVLWWIGVAAFVVFLPNAPYVLTDVLHFSEDVRATRSDWVVVFGLMPQYGLFLLVGLGAYALALWQVAGWLRRHGRAALVPAIELVLHGLSAVGIYLGRFPPRFNSWDLVTRPHDVAGTLRGLFDGRFPLVVIAVTFVALVVCTTALRWFAESAGTHVLDAFGRRATESVQKGR